MSSNVCHTHHIILALRRYKHLVSPPPGILLGSIFVSLVGFLCCVFVWLWFYVLCPVLPVSPDGAFWIAALISSNFSQSYGLLFLRSIMSQHVFTYVSVESCYMFLFAMQGSYHVVTWCP
jgi:hypothetical protein